MSVAVAVGPSVAPGVGGDVGLGKETGVTGKEIEEKTEKTPEEATRRKKIYKVPILTCVGGSSIFSWYRS